MTTSSDNRSPSSPEPGREHWKELSDAIAVSARVSVAELDSWFDAQLAELEVKQAHFVTRRTLRKKLRG